MSSSCLNGRKLEVVDQAKNATPLVIAHDAGEATRQAATDLAIYIEKISGARPEIVMGPKARPAKAIWVGIQPGLSEVYPELPLDFQHPEEILIACNGQHLVIAGRDRFVGQVQKEFGTVNAVYTFLQDHLNVRWLWPGPLGEDVIPSKLIRLSSFEYRYHPQILQRDVYRASSSPIGRDWAKFQRAYYDSFTSSGGHGFADWFEKYHKEHPDYFALQPDGTRSGYPEPIRAKLCESNPRVWEQWLENVEKSLLKDPTLNVFSAQPNDSHSGGICVCDNCKAWDNPKGSPWKYNYAGGVNWEWVAMTDREVKFWNILARKLKARFPQKRLYVSALAYGPTTPTPMVEALEDNVIIGYVAKFPLSCEMDLRAQRPKQGRQAQKEEFREWSKKAPLIMYRPNLWYFGGGVWGIPEVALKKTIEDIRFIADNRCMGVFIDTPRDNWATQGPMYYLLAQMAWNPYLDGQALLKDYYRRGFGKAAERVEAYWNLWEQANQALVDLPEFNQLPLASSGLVGNIEKVYTQALIERAFNLLKESASLVEGEPGIYRERIAFLETGLQFTNLMLQAINHMSKVRGSGGKDKVAVEKASAIWEEINELCRTKGPLAINLTLNPEGRFRSNVIDYLGPPKEEFRKAAGLAERKW